MTGVTAIRPLQRPKGRDSACHRRECWTTGTLTAEECGALGKLSGACAGAADTTQFHPKYIPNQYGGSPKDT